METNFQTSFIPKKIVIPTTVSTHASYTGSIFMIIAVTIFVVSFGGAGFVLIAKDLLQKQQVALSTTLKKNEAKFNIPLIEDLKKSSVKIDLASQLVKSHIAMSEVFEIIEGLTIEGVRFTSFDFGDASTGVANANTGAKTTVDYRIKMKGVANTFSSVAFQSDVFGTSKKFGTNIILKNPILSDLAVDTDGNVGFLFTADVSSADISYTKVLLGDAGPNTSIK